MLTSAALLLLLTSAKIHKISAQSADVARVRVAYVIPKDRSPQPGYEKNIKRMIGMIREFYAYEMDRQGFGRKTFNIESDATTNDPVIHLIKSPLTRDQFVGKGDVGYQGGTFWENSVKSVSLAGFKAYTPKTIWLTLIEGQIQRPDGSIQDGTAEGVGLYGTGHALCTGVPVALADPQTLNDHRPYDARVLSMLGPAKLTRNVSFPWYDGYDVSSIAAVEISAVAHELGHSFLLSHTFLNDVPQNGNLMGNGFRGWRGYAFPDKFPNEGLRMNRSSALIINLSPFFNPGPVVLSKTPPPSINIISPSGTMQLKNGAFEFRFSLSQPAGPGIAVVTLENGTGKNGVGVSEWREYPGSPKQIIDSIATTKIVPGEENTWRICAFDTAGNFSEKLIRFKAPQSGVGPYPSIFVGHTDHKIGEPIEFTASNAARTQDRYEWNFGDGSTAVGSRVTHAYKTPGFFEVKLASQNAAGLTGSVSEYMRIWPNSK